MHYYFKVKQLANKKSKSSSELPKEQTKSKESKSSSNTYASPWAEAVLTAGMPKIPKIKKVQVSILWWDFHVIYPSTLNNMFPEGYDKVAI